MDLTKDIMDFSLKLQNSNITTAAAATTESSNKNCEGPSLKIGLIVGGNTINMNTFDKLQKSSTPELLENAAKMATKVAADGQLTPPPRPMTSSEVVGFTIFEDTEMNLDPTLGIKPCRSLPASPNHLKSIQMPPLFDFRSSKPFVAAATAPEAEPKVIKLSADEPDIVKRKFKPAPSNNNSQQFCLRWNNYQNNLTNVFDELLQNESFVDVTLACEGQSIKAHKMVLSACSPYFQALFYDNPCQHPIVIMRDVGWQELKTLMEFMYKGEINVSQDQINPLLRVAEMLKIRGLAEVSANRMATATQHPLILEQRMTVYESDEEKNNVASDTVNGKSRCSGGGDSDESQAAKRPRLNAEIESDDGVAKQDLQNLHAVRMRKRSRDGHLIDGDRFSNNVANKNYDNLHASSPACEEHISANPSIAGSVATALTTSTIVRNPFASPPNQLSQTSSNAENDKISSPNELPASYRSMARNCSPSQSSNSGDVGVRSALVSPTDTNQLPLHARPAADVAAAFTNPNHPHHRAAQQLAAHHQLHAAAQSHAAMATALAAAASGTNTIPGVSNTASTTVSTPTPLHDDMEIKPEIAEMIREEERAKLIESGHPWSGGGSTNSSVTESYQYQLQSMWQKCWSTNQQNLVQQLRFRERGPLKSWRPEAMAEAIFSVLKEGLSLSQAARKYDIPYPTFVLYANRVHNMLGPSLDGGSDPRPKARGRPQRILLGMWPEELIRSVIKAVVFRDYREFKDDMGNLPFVNGQPHMSTHFASPNAIMTNGLPTAAKLAQNAAALASQDSASPLNTMTENFRRHLISQQQQQQQQQHQSPVSQSVNMYKSPAYLQRSEMDEASLEMVALAKQKNDRRLPDNLADLNKLGLMGMPGMGGGVMPTASSRGNQMPTNLYPTECDLEHDRERNRAKEREFKDTMQARQFGGRSVVPGGDSRMQSSLSFSSRSTSPYTSYLKGKEANQSVYNKRLLDSLPPGIDFEAIANGLLQKSVSKSPRFEDLFSGQEMNELLINPEANAAAAPPNTSSCSSPQRDHLMKIKLEQQQIGDMPHED